MLSRYSNIDTILKMSWEDAISIINKAYEKDFEEKIWQMWLTLYPNMDKKSFISFEDYKKKVIKIPTKINNSPIASKDDILNEVAEIRKKKARKERKTNGDI